ncbi:YciI family protein [Actinomadura atramentaria]|uniref:YciI family protein n=1 Tax=Actinomadura atramentaria TaxID=1990 RepID=UPI000527D6FC|nr:YciI family protein [Actinomadura atramentaria]
MMLMQFSAQSGVPPISTWTEAEVKAHIAYMGEFNDRLTADGEFVDAQGLADPATARIVRSGEGGAPVVTDGPFPETKEWLAGYWIVDVADDARAVALAAAASAAPGPGGRPLNMPIEVRPIGVLPEFD